MILKDSRVIGQEDYSVHYICTTHWKRKTRTDLYQRKTPTDSGTWLSIKLGVRLEWHEESDRDLGSGFVRK